MKAGLFFVLVSCALAPAVHAGLDEQLAAECGSAVCVLADSGLPVREYNPEEIRPPASMVKLMLMLMVCEGIQEEKWALDTPIPVSRNAESMGGSQVYLKEGEEWKLGDLLGALCVASANDAAMAIAEGLWKTKENYLEAMNKRAQALGMTHSVFNSVHGLPPDKGQEEDKTCAHDMAILARTCTQEPLIMEWVGLKELTFREGEAVKYNTNRLLWDLEGCDGLKTGFTRAAGWCVSVTAERDGIRLVAVVMGCRTGSGRFNLAAEILEEGFRETERVRLLAKGAPVDPEVPVQNCTVPGTRLTVPEEVWITVPKSAKADLKMLTETPALLRPPVEAGETLGNL
ncbi:MAG: D-alanyl-D-alanine carboxypeptidase, partial [Candidatus Hydrogenedentes bacterium]|nr:D-alanyl-D-alanine carboxypeptidase [Candidatus Hydrogenedentota bacterium]